MQKTKPIEYVQAILYHIKCHWRKLIMAVLIVATIVLALIWSDTQEDTYYYIGVGTGIIALLVSCVIYAPELGRAMDRFGLREVPEDEEV
jgi:hypothetical protein